MRDEIAKRGGIGLLNEQDILDFNGACQRVLELMLDYRWHSVAEINTAAGENGFPAARGLARLWDLKNKHPYEKRKKLGSKRTFEYRLVRKVKSEQISLFGRAA